MIKNQQILKLFIGLLCGILISHILHENFNLYRKNCVDNCGLHWKDVKSEILNTSTKQLVFIGVMTAKKYLNTRAKAVYETWGHNISGTLVFFSSEDSYSESLPLVSLIGIDDQYPPQKKSFAMLKYMHDNYIDKYEWFIRADDDVYFRMDRLELLLKSIDSSKPWFIGQTGKGNTEELGLLALNHDENFCMGGPGVVLSRETLKRITPYFEECLKNLYTTHEDVELGRCVKKFAGISCTWSYEMQVILYHNQSGDEAFRGNLKQREVHRAITLHPVKYPEYMHRLHKYEQSLAVQQYRHLIVKLYQDIFKSLKLISGNVTEWNKNNINNALREALPSDNEDFEKDFTSKLTFMGAPIELNRFKYNSLENLLEWNYFSKSLHSSDNLNPRRRLGSTLKEGLHDTLQEVMEKINSLSKQRGRIIDFKDTLYGYWRLNPVYGVDFILDLLLVYRKYRGHKMTVPVRRHAYIHLPFTGVDIREVEYTDKNEESVPFHKKIINNLNRGLLHEETNNKIINFILPLQGRYRIFKRFMERYKLECIDQKESTNLIIILFKDDFDWEKSLKLTNEYKRSTSHSIKVVIIDDVFSRGKALKIGTDLLDNNDLMLFIDVDIIFDYTIFRRIRSNTIQDKTVYFPIVFSLYKNDIFNRSYKIDSTQPAQMVALINEQNGFWRQFGFGIASLYKSDFAQLGGFNTSISGWGMEDVGLFDKAIKSNLKIIRTPDPGLIHVYHSSDCKNLETSQRIMCEGTKVSLFGSLSDLEKYSSRFVEL